VNPAKRQSGAEFSQPSPASAEQGAHKVDVFELARSRGSVNGKLAVNRAMRLRADLRDTSGAIQYQLDGFIDAQSRPAARLHLRADLPIVCDRCAQALDLPIDEMVTFCFVHDESELAALPVVADDEAEPLLGSDRFDLDALVEDQAILCVPVSPRHAQCPIGTTDSKPAVANRKAARPNAFATLPALLKKQR